MNRVHRFQRVTIMHEIGCAQKRMANIRYMYEMNCLLPFG